MRSTLINLALIGAFAGADVSTIPSTITVPPTPRFTVRDVTSTSFDWAKFWSTMNSMMKPEPPYAPQDSWYCATNNWTDYFVPPMPTGAFYTDLVYYARSGIEKTCTKFHTDCSDLGKKEWCDYTTLAPTRFSSDLSSLGSACSSWSSVHSSGLKVLPTACPDSWNFYGGRWIGRDVWTNRSKIFAQCYEERYSHGQAQVSEPSSSTTQTSEVSQGSSATGQTSKVLQPTSSSKAERKAYIMGLTAVFPAILYMGMAI